MGLTPPRVTCEVSESVECDKEEWRQRTSQFTPRWRRIIYVS